MGNHHDEASESRILAEAGRRLFLPAVCFDEDIAGPFRMSVASAAEAIAAGDFGAPVQIGGRWAVLKTTLMATLEARQVRLRPGPRADSGHGDRGGVA